MPQKILLITPPFTQLNTPYPATAYLKGYLDKKGYNCVQADLSIELFLKVFSKDFLEKVFVESNKIVNLLYPEIHNAKKDYLSSIETIVAFLQQPNTIKAYQILNDSFLPKFHRFSNLTELDFSFGDMGLLDKAKYFATLYIEELGDFIQANLDEDFGFTKYAEKIARTVKEQYGLKTVFHHHCGGFIETPEEIDQLMELTDPNLLGLCLDMGHYAFGGGDPSVAIEKYKERIWHVHFKDYDPLAAKAANDAGEDYYGALKRGVFCELGKGIVDFQSIVSLLKKLNYKDWIVVEQDVLPGMGNPKNHAIKNRNYIKTLGL